MFKALVVDNDKGIILVKGVPFGGPGERDVHGQFFTPRTNFLPHVLPLPPVFHFHGSKSGSLSDQIGETLSREQRQDGVWYRAKLFLDSANENVRSKANQLWESAKAGRLFASSGAVEATIKVLDTGEIAQWLVGELSLIDARNSRETPASFHATVIPVKADLSDIEAGDITVDTLNISTTELKPSPNTGGGSEISNARSKNKMADEVSTELLAQMQQQMTEMSTQMASLQSQVSERDALLQQNESTIQELRGVISTKSAEVAMSNHVNMVDQWIKDAKLSPSEREPMLQVLSFAYQADTTIKGDAGFVNAVKGLVDARPQNPTYGNPSNVYSNLNGSGIAEGSGGSIDPKNIAILRGYAEIPDNA